MCVVMLCASLSSEKGEIALSQPKCTYMMGGEGSVCLVGTGPEHCEPAQEDERGRRRQDEADPTGDPVLARPESDGGTHLAKVPFLSALRIK